jgi:ubiquinone/menaquinone biosynthesis C-methylase UbiE
MQQERIAIFILVSSILIVRKDTIMPNFKANLKSYLKTTLPYSTLEKIFIFYRKLNLYSQYKVNKARRIFEKALDTPAYLEQNTLEILHKTYSPPFIEKYDPKSVEDRAKRQSKEILDLILQEKASIKNFLELGCGKGMVSCILQRQGYQVTAIDFNDTTLDIRAVNEGLKFIKMDASQLIFEDESFDFIFSFNSFEHFSNPEAVLREAIRVLKTGGYIYLNFSPLFMSPWGLHANRFIHFPYPQILFPKEVIQDFVQQKGFSFCIGRPEVNEWSLEEYRQLWRRYSHRLKICLYLERTDLSHLDFIIKYSSVFKSKTKSFDDLIVSGIRVLFQKIK